jgi:hypothetical protein
LKNKIRWKGEKGVLGRESLKLEFLGFGWDFILDLFEDGMV